MEYPGSSAAPETWEKWLDSTVDRRINCARMEGRWIRTAAATPSGEVLHECLNCGRLSSGAEKRCHPLAGDKGTWR